MRKRKKKQRRKTDEIPLAARLVQLVFEHQDLFLQGEVLALSVPQLLAQGLQLGAMLRLPARQLLLVQERFLLQVSPQASHLLGLVCRGRGSRGAGLLQLCGGNVENMAEMRIS